MVFTRLCLQRESSSKPSKEEICEVVRVPWEFTDDRKIGPDDLPLYSDFLLCEVVEKLGPEQKPVGKS